MQLKSIFEEKGINTLPISYSAYNAFPARIIKTLMRNIEGRKYHLLYLIFVFVFDAFLPPLLTNPTIRRYGKIYQDTEKSL